MPFKRGDKVRVRVGQGQRHKDQPLNVGDIHEVQVEAVERDPEPLIGIVGFRRMFFAKRFEIAPELANPGIIQAPVAPAVPLIDPARIAEAVARVNAAALPVPEIAELPVDEVVAVPVYQVGDKVRITARVEETPDGRNCGWAEDMMEYLNDGQAYPIVMAHQEWYVVEFGRHNQWSFLPECFTLALEEEEIAPIEIAPQPRGKAAKPKVVKKEATTFRGKVAEKWLKDGKESPKTGICSFAIEKADGSISFHKDAPCHYQLQGQDAGATQILYSPWRAEYDIGMKKDKVDTPVAELLEMNKKWMDYVINRSPFRIAFVNQRVSTFMRYGVLLKTDVSIDIIAGACVALRMGTEFPEKLVSFIEAVKCGFDEDIAYLMCNMLQPVKGKADVYSVAYFGGGHQEMQSSMNAEAVFQFIVKGYDAEKLIHKKPYKEYAGNYSISNSIASSHGANITEWMGNNIQKEVIGQGWDTKTIVKKEHFIQLGEHLTNIINAKKEAA